MPASRWDTDTQATVAVARSIYSHLPKSGTPLWLENRNVCAEDPATVRPSWVRRAGRIDA